jgi:deoxyribose-phosphate aldolase
MLDTVRALTEGRALMKVILETGELPDLDTVERAARFAVAHGADFIKTSTGKSPVSATLPAAETMLHVIADADRPVGLKPSGGIGTAAAAADYIAAAERIMGAGWVSPSTFRFGASGLLNALLAVTGESAVSGTASNAY